MVLIQPAYVYYHVISGKNPPGVKEKENIAETHANFSIQPHWVARTYSGTRVLGHSDAVARARLYHS